MILKHLDDHTNDKEILNSYLENPHIPENIKTNIKTELRNINAGIKAQKEAAYNIDFLLSESINHYVIHDLRLAINGRVAQFDHIILNRLMEIIVCETKSFSEGISINEQLEFTAFYNNKPYGIPSPIEQNEKHILVLKDVFADNLVKSPTRLGFKLPMTYESLILVSNSARITRPEKLVLKNTAIMKNEAFAKHYQNEDNAEYSKILKVFSSETLKEIATSVLKLHTPIEFNWAAKFGIEKYVQQPIIDDITIKKEDMVVIPVIPETTTLTDQPKKMSTQVCNVCKQTLDNSVVFWCRKNKAKFNGQLLCREHQKGY